MISIKVRKKRNFYLTYETTVNQELKTIFDYFSPYSLGFLSPIASINAPTASIAFFEQLEVSVIILYKLRFNILRKGKKKRSNEFLNYFGFNVRLLLCH